MKFAWQGQSPLYFPKNTTKHMYTYESVLHGQRVTIKRYSPYEPKEQMTQPAYETSLTILDRISLVSNYY